MDRSAGAAIALVLACAASGCRGGTTAGPVAPSVASPTASPSSTPSGTGSSTPSGTGSAALDVRDPEHAVAPPGPLTGDLLPADLLVHSLEPLDADLVAAVGKLEGVAHVEPIALAQVGIQDRVVNVAAVDAAAYRRFTTPGSAGLQEAWDRVAGGEVAVVPALGRRLRDEEGYLRLGNDRDAARVHVGALTAQVPQVDAVVNTAWGTELGMRPGNALLISVDRLVAPQRVRPAITRLVGRDVSVQVLGPDLDVSAVQTAVLTGGSVAQAVGSFSYRVGTAGRIVPQQEWVAGHIRTEAVPILGAVTCHAVMLPQLRAALAEVAASGLSQEIDPDQYAGCYHPRFIAGSTQLSLHAFGIAVDLNVPGNQRGTVGEMDPRVVAIFERWGFAWGGRWSWTDPMHFEMDRLVEVR
ncbi:M15 family metallopeptidase [Nocardioides houyundeii]|uniref:M15 family metallopeptidase n=1 Tax=Nocardioides houyundeii TaxID=2045452 RepID=UPI000C7926A9|nr:M15 family metallopeptidase [Nocardioides houyundeii]